MEVAKHFQTKSEVPPIISKLYDRWRKRIFANDEVEPPRNVTALILGISITKDPYGDRYWRMVIKRTVGEKWWEAVLDIDSWKALENPTFMLDADKEMRFALKAIKAKGVAVGRK